MSALKRKIASGLAVAALAVTGAVIGAAPANAASGKAHCATSNIVGIWVDVENGTDGWATRSANKARPTPKRTTLLLLRQLFSLSQHLTKINQCRKSSTLAGKQVKAFKSYSLNL